MPHLQFEINKCAPGAAKERFSEAVRALFARIMDTGTDHISISIREYPVENLSIGRAVNPADGVGLVNADIREGRTIAQRRALALGFIDLLEEYFCIPPSQAYVTFTEHKGEDFHLNDRYLASWHEGEDPLAEGEGSA